MPDAPFFARPSVALVLAAYDGFTRDPGRGPKHLTPEWVDVLASLLLSGVSPGEPCERLWEKLLWDHHSRWSPRVKQVNLNVQDWPLDLNGLERLEDQSPSVVHDTEWLMATMMAAGFSPWEGDGRVVLGFLEQGLHRLVKVALAWPQVEILEGLLSTSRRALDSLRDALKEEWESESWGHWLLRVDANQQLWEVIDSSRTSPPSLPDMKGACALAACAHAHWFAHDPRAQQELQTAWQAEEKYRSTRDEWLLAGLWNSYPSSEGLKQRARLTILGDLRGKGALRNADDFMWTYRVVYDTAMEEKEDALGLPFLLAQSWVEQAEGGVCWSVVASRLVGRFLRRNDHCVEELPMEEHISTSASPLSSLLEAFGPVLGGEGPRGLPWSGLFALSFAELVEENERGWMGGQVAGALEWSKWLLDQGVDTAVIAMAWGEWLMRFPQSREGHARGFYTLMKALDVVEVAPWCNDENEKMGVDWGDPTHFLLNFLGGLGKGWGKGWDELALPMEWGDLEEDELVLAMEFTLMLGHPVLWRSLGDYVSLGSLPGHLLSLFLKRLSKQKVRSFEGYGEAFVKEQDLSLLKGRLKEGLLREVLPLAEEARLNAVRF